MLLSRNTATPTPQTVPGRCAANAATSPSPQTPQKPTRQPQEAPQTGKPSPQAPPIKNAVKRLADAFTTIQQKTGVHKRSSLRSRHVHGEGRPLPKPLPPDSLPKGHSGANYTAASPILSALNPDRNKKVRKKTVFQGVARIGSSKTIGEPS